MVGDDDIGGSGYSLEGLSAYHDRGRRPRVDAIETNAECQAVLASIEHLGRLTRDAVEIDGARPLDEAWYDGLMREVAREFRAGRDLPLTPPGVGTTPDDTTLLVTEGALYELVRAAGDAVDGALIGRVRLSEDSSAGSLDIAVTISIRFGRPFDDVADGVRRAVREAVRAQVGLRVGCVDVEVHDVHVNEEDE